MDGPTRVWFILAVSCVCMLTCGTGYAVSAWSPQLKLDLDCSQSEIELVGQLGNIGSYFGPVIGALIYVLPEWSVSLLSLLLTLLGYVLMAHTVGAESGSALWPLRSVAPLGVMFALSGFASNLQYTLLLSVNLHNVPPHRRGSVVALLATCMGLSASCFTVFYGGSVAPFLQFVGVCIVVACVAAGIVVRKVDTLLVWGRPDADADAAAAADKTATGSLLLDEQGARSRVRRSGDTDLQEEDEEEDALDVAVAASASVGGARRLSFSSSRPADGGGSINGGLQADPFGEEERRVQLIGQQQERDQSALQRRTCGGGLCGQVFGAIMYLVQNRNYWLLLTVFFLIAGAGLMHINNLGHVVQSLNGGVQDGPLTTYLILLLSLSNGAGRLLMGLTDYAPCRKGWWLVGVCALMALSHFANAWLFVRKDLIALGAVGVGLAYGGLWAVTPIVVSEFFGVSSFSLNFGWVTFVAGLGSVCFNNFAGQFYDAATLPGASDCIGPQCYRSAFVLSGCAATVAALVALPLVAITQRGRKKQKNVQS